MNTHPIAPRIATFPTTYADVTDRKETWWTAHKGDRYQCTVHIYKI